MAETRRLSFRSLCVAATASLCLTACAPNPPEAGFAYDPYERSNREFHEFNKGLDTVLVRPASIVYDEIVPRTIKYMVSNGLDMLRAPARIVNFLLQGEGEAALRTAGRTGLNLIMGLGVLDPATEFGLPRERTDFGITLARWGVYEGPFVVLPLLGPATLRDGTGRVVEIAADPFNFITGIPALNNVGLGTLPLGVMSLRSDNAEVIDRLLYESDDSYIALRSAYLQRRRREVAGGATASELPDVFD